MRLVLLGGGLVAVLVGQLEMRDGPSPLAVSAWLAGLVVVVVLQWATMADASAPAAIAPPDPLTVMQRALLGAAAVETAAVALLAWDRDSSSDQTALVIAWVLALGALVAAAAGPSRQAQPSGAPVRRPALLAGWPAWERWAFAGIVALATAVRVYRLDRYPWTFDGDAAGFALLAREVREGVLRDPFTTGYYDQGTLFAYLQAASTWVFGETMAGVNAVSAIAGVVSVAFTYLLARRWWGTRTALVAGVVLAVLHMHVFISRLALNNAVDMAAIVLLLYLVDRAFVDARRVDAALAGVVLGLSQYFYFGARVLTPLTVVVVASLIVHVRRVVPLRHGAALAGWLAAGASIAFLPLGLHYVDEPWDYNSRSDTVSILGDWRDVESERTGRSDAEVLARQARDAALLPFATRTEGHYRPGPPLLGWPVAVPAAIGIAVATAGVRRRRHAPVAVGWWGSLAGVGLTVGLSTQRWSIALPLVAICVAIGIDAVVRALLSSVPAHVPARRVASVLVVAAVTAISVWNVTFYFRSSNDLALHGDINTVVATQLARELDHAPAGTVVHMAAAPRMGYRSHHSIEFLAPQVVGHDVVEPITTSAAVPAVTGPTVFVFLPERVRELALVRAMHPGGTIRDVRWRDGQVLYTTYRVGATP